MRELLNNQKLKLNPLGFIDDDPVKIGKKLLGYPVLGAFADLTALHKKLGFGGLLISFQQNDPDHIDDIKGFCKENGLFFKKFVIHIGEIDL
jgi:UDP-GlcNAc:undecaprenyl-phosphate GlcNAc-1-phosphate transferase